MEEFGAPKRMPAPEFHSHASDQGAVFTSEGITYATTSNAEYVVPVPSEMASFISLALRAQDKIKTERFPNLERVIKTLNCRKSIFVAGGAMNLAEATDISKDIDGLEVLYSETEKIQEGGQLPFVVTENYDEIQTWLDEYEGKFPCAIHIFEIDKGKALAQFISSKLAQGESIDIEDVKKMHRVHSLIVVGEDDGEYVCFQKMGPRIEHPFEIVTIDDVFESYELPSGRIGVIFVGEVK